MGSTVSGVLTFLLTRGRNGCRRAQPKRKKGEAGDPARVTGQAYEPCNAIGSPASPLIFQISVNEFLFIYALIFV